jgi:hypothetical protein
MIVLQPQCIPKIFKSFIDLVNLCMDFCHIIEHEKIIAISFYWNIQIFNGFCFKLDTFVYKGLLARIFVVTLANENGYKRLLTSLQERNRLCQIWDKILMKGNGLCEFLPGYLTVSKIPNFYPAFQKIFWKLSVAKHTSVDPAAS